MLEKNWIVLKKTAAINLTQTALIWFGLVWFGFCFKSQLNQTKPHAFLSCGLDDFYPQNRSKPHRKDPYNLVSYIQWCNGILDVLNRNINVKKNKKN